MRRHLIVFLLAVAAATLANGQLFVEDGQEYIYDTTAVIVAGTMDTSATFSGVSAKMKTRMQVSGRTLNMKFENMKWSQYNGKREVNTWPFDDTTYTSPPGPAPQPFAIKLTDEGLFKELVIPSGAPTHMKNIMRGWAAQLQINSGEIKQGKQSFKSKEQLLQGDCDVSYTVTEGAVRKSVSHTDDCDNRVYRVIDDYRGYRCDAIGTDKGMGYPSSIANTVFLIEQKGSKFQVNGIVSTGSFVAQFYEEEGAAMMVVSNSTSKLINVKSSSGDINPSGDTITDLSYEFSDNEYKWNKNRDLKAKEPFFSSGMYFGEDSKSEIMDVIRSGIAGQKMILDTLDTDAESIAKAHKAGIANLFPAFYALDYDGLRTIAEELLSDKSDTGVMKSNIFNELLANTGTTAAAMVVKDLVMENKFDNDRDAAKALTAVPFHIRRPNIQLVKEYEALLDFDGGRFTKMAAPLAFGHLVRMTCERAGPMMSPESVECVKTFASKYVKMFWNKYTSTNDREEKGAILNTLMNMRFGGQSEALKPLIYGKMEDDSQLRSMGLWASGWEALLTGKGVGYFLPIFSDRSLDSELRISALEMIMYSRPSAAEMSTILTVLYADKDYEVINYAYTLFQRYADSIDECSAKTRDLAKYFLKYMRQYSGYETDWGFGVSKTYQRQFIKKKYGYSGSYQFWVMGSQSSTTPLAIGMAVTNTMMTNYVNYLFSIHLRIEGLAKSLVRKFKTTDPATWKTADLEQILSGDMGIRERPDQPVRVQVTIMLKGSVIFNRMYKEGDSGKDGKLGSFLDTLKDLGDTYTLNHQRAVQGGAFIYEQPSTLGIPLAIMSQVTTLGSLSATVKRGNHRGLLYRDVSYEANFFTQSNRMAVIPMKSASYGIINDRIYHVRIPRKFVVGVNPIKKELKLSITRPSYDNPWRILMHSQTWTVVRGNNIKGTYSKLQENCPTCQNRVMVSRGPDAAVERVIVDRENTKRGSKIFAKFFDCETGVSRGRTTAHTIGALMPYNKSPRTLWTSIMMGIRQIRTYFLYFPRSEKCGAMVRWSQSKTNPVKEIEISIRGNMEKNGERMFFRGRKWFIKGLIKAKGEPADRVYRINLSYEFTPGNLNNKIKIQMNRLPVPALGVEPYSACMALENSYPDFSKEFLGFDENRDLKVTGKAMVQYGKGTQCSDASGEIRVNFQHSTTQEARDELKNKWYYKKCMETKNSPAWSSRNGFPLTEPCYMAVWDGTSARSYSWNVEFVKLSPRMKSILSKAQTVVKAGLLPYWDLDPESMGVDGDIGPFLNVKAVFKNDEKNVDIEMETRQGKEEYEDVPLRLNWSKRLRNLKFTKTLKRLMDMKIINPCIATSESIRTNDNVTYTYEPSSCWTLTSAHCGPNPAYAVFSKKGGSANLDALVMLGGHKVELMGGSVKVNGEAVNIADGQSHELNQSGTEILKIFRWGSTYNVYSFLKVWVGYDGNFVQVVPAPSTKGQHCGICGNYNRNKFDEMTGKDLSTLSSAADMVNDWKWKC